VTRSFRSRERGREIGPAAAEIRNVQGNSHGRGALVPRNVLDIATEAARGAGRELADRFGRAALGVATKRGPTDLVSDADRAAEAAVGAVLDRYRPDDGILAEEASVDRAGTTGLRWVVDPLDGTVNFLAGIPLFCVSIACEDRHGTIAGVVFDPIRDELFAGVRGGPLRMDGAAAPGRRPDELAAAVISGGIASATVAEAKRAAKLEKRLFRRVGQRRALGSAALELAWTASHRLDVCFHEQWIHPWDVAAGLFLCEQSGLRVHRLPPLDEGLAPRFLAAREPLAAEVLELVGPGAKERRRAARHPASTASRAAAAVRRAAA
jgi:myo-inositol-1(or 4)-monophosphatase